MYKTLLMRATALAVCSFLIATMLPLPEASAQTTRDWRNFGNGEEMLLSSRTSSSIQRKINKLDDDEVDEFPIPILFGVSLNQLTKNYGDPRGGGTRSHEGLDIMAAKGAYIVSPTEAVVTRVGSGSSSGKYVNTANPGGETFIYMHLDDIADGVKAGTELKKGDLIGYVGNTGNASGGAPHLHFEVRDGREATDPYPRITKEFTLKERINAVEHIIEESDDEEEEAEKLVASYKGIFIAAKAQDIDLPEEIEDALAKAGVSPTATSAAGFSRDLTLGSQGDDVVALQALLIAKDAGPAAKALASAGATGYFGPITQRALIEYQMSASISPAVGYFGPLTRAKIAAL